MSVKSDIARLRKDIAELRLRIATDAIRSMTSAVSTSEHVTKAELNRILHECWSSVERHVKAKSTRAKIQKDWMEIRT